MTVAPSPGNVRFRAFQLGQETTFGTAVAATRRMPWRYSPTVDPHWTTPDVDTGTLDPAIAPYRTAIDITGQATGPLAGNDASAMWGSLLKGGVTPSSLGLGAYEWQFSPASKTADPLEIFTGQWGDEVVGDQFQYVSMVTEALQLQFPQDLGPIMISADMRGSEIDYPFPMTTGLNVDTNPAWLYAADTTLYINDNAGAIGITPLVDTMHDASIQITNNLDVKRFANGSNQEFSVAGYGRGARTMQTTFTFAKSPAGIAESVKWLNDNPQERFISLDTVSRKMIGASAIPYSQRVRFAGYWFTRSEQAVGSNSAIQLVCNHIYDPNLVAPIDVRVRNGMATLLG